MAREYPTYSEEELESEEWRPIQGWENIYEVSNIGRIKRLKPSKGATANKMLSPRTSIHGYYTTDLKEAPRKEMIFVHRAVIEAFQGQRPKGMHINHIDGIKKNNRLSNLEYVTPLENAQHAKKLGLIATGARHGSKTHPEKVPRGENHFYHKHPELLPHGENHRLRKNPELAARGESNGMAKLKKSDIIQIRDLYNNKKANMYQIAASFHISVTNVHAIIHRKLWKHI